MANRENVKKLQMMRQISAGFVIYRKTQEGIRYLLLYKDGAYWNFPKGKLDSEEGVMGAALRETEEETGLARKDIAIKRGFKTEERYTFRASGKSIRKKVIFFLAETNKAHIDVSSEHNGFGWFKYQDAMRMCSKHKDTQKVLERAHNFIVARRR